MNAVPRIIPSQWVTPRAPVLTEENMEELRARLDELRDMVVRLVERDGAGEKQSDKLDARIVKLEDQVDRLNLETGKLGVKMGIIVTAAIAAVELIPRFLDKIQLP